jgi:DNA-binding NtrC family response regulator
MMSCGPGSIVSEKVELGRQFPPRVLIVEDNALIALDLEDILKSNGCEVVGPRVSVREALEDLEQESIDVAVVDFLLEDGNAAPLAQALNGKGIPFAICTGAAESEISAQYPHTPILGKPYNPDDVHLVLNSLIASRLANV